MQTAQASARVPTHFLTLETGALVAQGEPINPPGRGFPRAPLPATLYCPLLPSAAASPHPFCPNVFGHSPSPAIALFASPPNPLPLSRAPGGGRPGTSPQHQTPSTRLVLLVPPQTISSSPNTRILGYSLVPRASGSLQQLLRGSGALSTCGDASP